MDSRETKQPIFFCPECGHKLQSENRCAACGKFAPSDLGQARPTTAGLPAPRARFQFSLTSMFLFVTLVACCLAVAKTTSYPVAVAGGLLLVGAVSYFRFLSACRVARRDYQTMAKREAFAMYLPSFLAVLACFLLGGYAFFVVSPVTASIDWLISWSVWAPAPRASSFLEGERLIISLGGVIGLTVFWIAIVFSWPRFGPLRFREYER